MDAKYDPEAEQEAISWMNDILGDEGPGQASGKEKVQEALKDGTILCK